MTSIDPKAETRRKILLGMSGGVDSSVAAFLLRQQGWEVYGLSLLTDESCRAGLEDAAALCRRLEIEWELLDIRDIFKRLVIDDFISSYVAGRTPNPCVICNPAVKFAALYEAADRLGCSAVATGHYADVRINPANGRYALVKTPAGLKDQTYFMYRLSQDQLARLVLPLAGMNKQAVRGLAAEAGLLGAERQPLSEKPDSQDCCFIPDGDYAAYLERELNSQGRFGDLAVTQPGNVINTSGQQIGTHKGLIHYTLGQRKGFQVQTTERLFVVGRDSEANTITVGPYDLVFRDEIRVTRPVYSGLPAIEPGERLAARIRNSAPEAACTVYPNADGSLRVVFDRPAAAPAPGQSCVLYRDGLIMAGGFIDS